MTRQTFGGTAQDQVGAGEDGPTLVGSTVWTAQTGGTQVTDLLTMAGVPITTLSNRAVSLGLLEFQGPNDDSTVLWVDRGNGPRVRMTTVNNVAAASGSGLPATIQNKTAAYTALAGDFVQGDTTTAAFTVTLPTAPATGALVAVKRTAGPNTLTVVPAGGGTIDGDATATIVASMAGAVFEHVGSNVWRIMAVMTSGVAGALLAANNLSDVADAPSSRTNLGLGTAATVNTGIVSGAVPVLGVSGTLAVARLATGTPNGTKFVRDDGVLAAPASGANPYTIASGQYVSPSLANTFAAGTPSVNLMRATPLDLPHGVTVIAIGIKVTTGVATSVVRLGLYSDNGLPNTLLVDAGTVDCSTTGYKEAAVASLSVAAGRVWLVYCAQIAAATVICLSSPIPMINVPTQAGTMDAIYPALYNTAGGITAGLPASFGAASVLSGSNAPRVYIKVA